MRCFVFLTCLLASPAWAGDNPVSDANAVLNKAFPADGPGAAVHVLRHGKTLLLQGYGLADIAKKTPMTPDTAFDLASVSKQFTAMAIMLLAERGKLTYDDPVQRWVPELPVFAAKRDLTLRDLLTHTSGIPDYLGVFKGPDAEFAKLTNADIPRILAKSKLRFEPGAKYEYSNSNYALLPLVVEKASGKTFARFLHDHIFVPAGMTSTKVADEVPFDVPLRANGYARQMLVGKRVESRRDGPICGDGNVFSTARDLARWDAALTHNLLVSAATMEQAYTPPKLAEGNTTNYGFGWMVSNRDGKRTVWHNGGWAGTRTTIVRKLTDKMTVIVLCNDESASPDNIARDVIKCFD